MGAQLDTKDPKTIQLARKLAQATGQPITQAIGEPLLSKGKDFARTEVIAA